MSEPLKTYVKMQGPTSISGTQWVEWGSVRYDDLAAEGWQVVPGDQATPEERSQYWTAGRTPDELVTAWRVLSLAERLLVAAYSAALPLQGEDVRTVVRQARLFYDELKHPTEPPVAPIEPEGGDD